MKNNPDDYVTQVHESLLHTDARAWNALLPRQCSPSPFMRHEYLAAMERSGSATSATGWRPRVVTLSRAGELHAACAIYLKDHSYGEYVFDWAWAHAWQRAGLAYYPKALVAVPFTPVPGARLLARDAATRKALLDTVLAWCRQRKLSSLHLLFLDDDDVAACEQAGLLLRHTVQFHWHNLSPGGAGGRYRDFDAFLASLAHDKRKKIRQERRKVADAGVTFRWSTGAGIAKKDWDLFYRCYERTYFEHGNAPYLTRDFFARMAREMPQHWLLFVAERGGRAIGASLVALSAPPSPDPDDAAAAAPQRVAYGRYWGALERIDCLHFEACYYQPLQWCIAHGYDRFEGGAQGEHKMARALMPVKTHSAHWLAHPAFAGAIERFLEREDEGIASYLGHLQERSPFRKA